MDGSYVELRYPIWTLVDIKLPPKFPENVATLTYGKKYRMMRVFQEFQSATRFLQYLKNDRLIPCILHMPQNVFDALDQCQKNGAEYVGVNPDYRLSDSGEYQIDERASLYPIDQFRGTLRKHIGDAPFSVN
jgi:hypothetical protein